MPDAVIYLDNNATTPVDPRVVEAMLPYFTEKFGNAASKHHAFGWTAEDAVDLARTQVAGLIGCEAGELYFTSGATESVNMAIKGVFDRYRRKGNHVITLATEHSCVMGSCRSIEQAGGRVTYLKVDADGLIDLDALKAAIDQECILISVMYANNETGVIQPIAEIGKIAREKDILFHTDATQALGKIPLNVRSDQISLLSCSAHKLYGPKGVGALYMSRKAPRVALKPLIDGGGHEKGIRAGTLNVPGIVGFGKACALAAQEMEADSKRLSELRDRLENKLLKIAGTQVNGSKSHRLAHVTNIRFEGLKADLLMAAMPDVAVSSGSACTSASPKPSHVLLAMGLSETAARASLRFSLGRFTDRAAIDQAIESCLQAVDKLREDYTSP